MSDEFRDYAADPRAKTKRRSLIVVHTLLATAMVAMLGTAWVFQRRGEVAQTQAAEADLKSAGPPCRALTQAEYAALPKRADRTFSFGGMTFGRRFGHAECDMAGGGGLSLKSAYPVCRFTGPDLVTVGHKGHVEHFETGVGKPAVVTVRNGVVSCAIGDASTASDL